MKKIITAIVALIVCATGASAATEFDLSGMSLDELIALQQQVQMAMWETDDWQEVEVPQGIYKIGVDIPAGMWTITTFDFIASLSYAGRVNEYNTDVDDEISDQVLEAGDSLTWNLVEGTYLMIEYGSVIFTEPTAPNLGFK